MSALGLATLGAQCRTALGLASLGVFCAPVFVSKPERVQDFEALQREQLLKDLNRNLKTADVNKMIKFSGSARISESSNVNRTSKLGSKRGKTTLKGKNRTLH